MTNEFTNDYADLARARAYSQLQFPGTYYLAFRDLPAIFSRHVAGRRAMDFGCGAGRSTRFLRDLGFDAIGVDISEAMICEAQRLDPAGRYVLIRDGIPPELAGRNFDLLFASFTFDNVGAPEHKIRIFTQLRELLSDEGRIVTIVSTPELYRHEWTSFATADFPENERASDGDLVRTIIRDIPDARPVVDMLCGPSTYDRIHEAAGLETVECLLPVGDPTEPYAWVSEARIAPWAIRVLARAGTVPRGN